MDLFIETWRSIINGKYEVSSHGRIRSWYGWGRRRSEPTIIKPWQTGRKYKSGKRGALSVRLKVDNEYKRFKVHHLVLEAFVCHRPYKCECAHLDGNIENNRLNNLQWVTHKENEDHKRTHGTLLCGGRMPNAKLTDNNVREIFRMADNGCSHGIIADKFKVNRRNITNILCGNRWKHLGLIHIRRKSIINKVQRGENIKNSKLTEDKVRLIRGLSSGGGLSQQKIANMFGVCRAVIRSVVKRKTWDHVE